MRWFFVLILASCSGCAHSPSPFDGTWKTNLDRSKFSPEPIIFSVNNGMYDCCVPKVHVKADGSDQPLTGQPSTTIAVKEIDPHTITIVVKREGKLVSEQMRAASEDGRTLHAKTTLYPLEGNKPIIQEVTAERVGNPMSGANVASGSWRTQKMSGSENLLLVTFKVSGSKASMSASSGVSWTAKFDGKNYPVKGSYTEDSVSLKRIDDRTIEASYKASGTLSRVSKMTVSLDGKTMTSVSESKLTGRISTYVATKQ